MRPSIFLLPFSLPSKIGPHPGDFNVNPHLHVHLRFHRHSHFHRHSQIEKCDCGCRKRERHIQLQLKRPSNPTSTVFKPDVANQSNWNTPKIKPGAEDDRKMTAFQPSVHHPFYHRPRHLHRHLHHQRQHHRHIVVIIVTFNFHLVHHCYLQILSPSLSSSSLWRCLHLSDNVSELRSRANQRAAAFDVDQSQARDEAAHKDKKETSSFSFGFAAT